MNAVALAVVAFLALVFQSALAARLAIGGARPDWILVYVVFLGLYARSSQAVISGLVLGACADLLSVERFGLLAISYALAASGVAGARQFLFRYRATTQFMVTMVAALVVHAGWLVYRRAALPGPTFTPDSLALSVLSSVYTGAWAPVFHGGLLRAARWIGVPKPKYRFSEMHSSGMDA